MVKQSISFKTTKSKELVLKKQIWNTIEIALFYYSEDSSAGHLWWQPMKKYT